MKAHSGMRPQDIVVLLKIATKGKEEWLIKDLAAELFISQSEVSESINRSVIGSLLAADKHTLMRGALLDFLKHGLKHVFPQRPGAIVRGIPTSHSALPLKERIQSSESYVWPHAEGKVRGQKVEPLYHSVPSACLKDKKLYELLALTDALRLGKVREKNIAMEELALRIK